MLNWLGLPVAASTHAAEIDHMIVLVHWLMLVLFVGWGAFFLFVLFRFRRGANPKASYAGAKGKFAKGTEVAVAIIEVVLLVVYAIPAWAKRVKALPSENEAVVVARRRRAVRVERPLSRAGRQVRAHRHQAGRRRQPARPRSHAIRPRKTTSRRSTS